MENFTASIHLWNECNFNCSFCIGARSDIGNKKWDSDNAKLQQLKKFFSATGKWEIALIGGEPLINPYLPKFCEDIIADGHVVKGVTTNASIPMQKLFTVDASKSFEWLTFSYHPIHEASKELDKIFCDNIEYVVKNGIHPTIIYVLLPDRIARVNTVVEKFEKMGARVQLSPLYGSYNGNNYPGDYNEDERKLLNKGTENIVTMQLLKHGARTSTLQPCSAGHKFFEIFLESGKVTPCPHQQNNEIFNFLNDDLTYFDQKRYTTPQECRVTKCVCGYSDIQQKFLEQYDANNMENYEEWEKLCSGNDKVDQYWKNINQLFVNDLTKLLKGNKVFIWGAGIHTSKILSLLTKENFPIVIIRGIIDSNPAKDGQLLNQILVVSADVFFREEAKACSDIIISSACYENEIYEQIEKKLGKSSVNIIRLYDGTFPYVIPI